LGLGGDRISPQWVVELYRPKENDLSSLISRKVQDSGEDGPRWRGFI
jgi:hypothetical protein